MLKGSVLEPENKRKLMAVRIYLMHLKNAKLAARHEKNKSHSWDKQAILDHLVDEIREFSEASGFVDQLLELADISNLVDILAMAILEETTTIGDGP